MAHEIIATNSAATATGDERVVQYESVPDVPTGGVPSHLGEQFGMGFAVAVFLGALLGVAVTWALGGSALLALFVALGAGFVLSPIAGILAVELSD